LRGRSRSNNSPPLGLNQNNGSEQAPRGEIPGEAAASAGNNNAAAAAMAVGIPAENNHPFLGNNNDEQMNDDGNDGCSISTMRGSDEKEMTKMSMKVDQTIYASLHKLTHVILVSSLV